MLSPRWIEPPAAANWRAAYLRMFRLGVPPPPSSSWLVLHRSISSRVPCQKCGASILPATAERTGGLCMPCARPRRRDLGNLLAPPPTELSLEQYRALVRDLPRPTSEQRQNFIEYVCTAHSWYKHLPHFLPGAPFYFFLDKFSAWDLVALEDGSYVIAEREKPGFHYSAIPTLEYRTRFGFLSYACGAGTSVIPLSHKGLLVPRDKVAAVVRDDGVQRRLPRAILEAGRVELTSVIFPYNWAPFGWPKGPPPKAYWPSESGGQAMLDKILKRNLEVQSPELRNEADEREFEAFKMIRMGKGPSGEGMMAFVRRARRDPILWDLTEPERRRQKAEMLKAIDRICALVHQPATSAPESPP